MLKQILSQVPMLVCALFTSQALALPLLTPGEITPLAAGRADAIEAKTALERRCRAIAVRMIFRSATEECRKALADSQFQFTKESVNYCAALQDQELEFCLRSTRNRVIPESHFNLCNGVRSSAHYYSDRASCLDYFATTKSYFQTNLVEHCLKRQPSFTKAMPCLNSVRDRQIELATLQEACSGKADTPASANTESYQMCLDRVANQASHVQPLQCAPTASRSAGGSQPTEGQR